MGLQTQSLLAKAARLRVETEHTQQLRQQLKQSTRYLETVADGNTESVEENDAVKEEDRRVAEKIKSEKEAVQAVETVDVEAPAEVDAPESDPAEDHGNGKIAEENIDKVETSVSMEIKGSQSAVESGHWSPRRN